jgi:SAM-dependent methyltransferase
LSILSDRQTTPGQAWDRFAEMDPYTYILTSLKRADPQEFWESGYRTVREELLPVLRTFRVSRNSCLELGCGLGRLVFPLASHFQKMIGVDISSGMIQRACRFAKYNRIDNVAFSIISGPENLLQAVETHQQKIDFIYSLLVFQHIADLAMIDGYLQAIGILLHEQGIAYVQFDTRPKTIPYHLKCNSPDFLLPRFWRRGIRRIRQSPAAIEKSIQAGGMEILLEITPGSAHHRYVLRKASRPSPL